MALQVMFHQPFQDGSGGDLVECGRFCDGYCIPIGA
jgi:hypothetical protein